VKRLLFALLFLSSYTLSACAGGRAAPSDHAAPIISSVSTSSESFSVDCPPTFVTVTAHVTDPSGIAAVQLWYRVGSDHPYIPVEMAPVTDKNYQATVKGTALSLDAYGNWEFYVTAKDKAGNSSKSPTNASVQFLPCVSH
jgi:hypothetical protein